ncbi:MAG: outer membrane lipoprotein chaperone LolA [bacterium]
MTKSKIPTTFILVVLMTTQVAFGQSANEIVKRVQKRYRSLKTFSAEFEETFTWTLAKRSQSSRGRFFIKKPDRFRLETEEQILTSDGKTVWRYAIQDSQVFVTDAESDPDFPLLKNLLFDYVENYSHLYLGHERLDEVDCDRLKLIPKEEDSFVTELFVWIDRKEWLTRRVEYRDIHRNVTTYALSDIRINKKIDDGIFVFHIPEGTEVIDTR